MPNRSLSLASLATLLAATLAGLVFVPGASAAALVTAAVYKDLDSDGRIDAVTLTFSGNILDASIRPTDFLLSCKPAMDLGCLSEANVVPYTWDTRVNPPPTLAGAVSGVNDPSFTLLFSEVLGWRSNARPELLYFGPDTEDEDAPYYGSLVDLGFVPVEAILEEDVEEADGANPVFWGAAATEKGDEVLLSFSEPVHGAASTSFTPFTGSSFAYVNDVTALPDCVTDLFTSGTGATVFPSAASATVRILVTESTDAACNAGSSNFGFDAGELGFDAIDPVGVYDMAGLPLVTSNQPWLPGTPNLPISRPQVLDLAPLSATVEGLQGGEGSTKLLLHFNTGLVGVVAGTGDGILRALGTGDFQFVRNTPPGANIIAVDYSAGSDVVGLTLSNNLGNQDLGGNAFLQISNPNGLSGPLGGSTGKLANRLQNPGAVRVTDTFGPRMSSAKTVDIDSNGLVDAMLVTFSEAVKDGADGGYTGVTPDKFTIARPGFTKLAPAAATFQPMEVYTTTDIVPPSDCIPAGSGLTPTEAQQRYQAVGSNVANDGVVFLCLDEGQLAPLRQCTGGTIVPGTPICVEGDGSYRHVVSGTTGLLSMGPIGMCADDDCYLPGSLPWVSSDGVRDMAGLSQVTARNVMAADGAPPALRVALTQDRTHDGRIDAYALVFSEAILDASLPAAQGPNGDFTVKGRTVGSPLLTTVLDLDGDGEEDDDVTVNGFNDELVLLPFLRGDGFDSGETPDVATRPTCVCNLRDVHGNRLVPMPALGPEESRLPELDFAPPVVARIEGAMSLASIEVVFSEPVRQPDEACGMGSCNLDVSSFAYANVHPGGGTSIVGVAHEFAGAEPSRVTLSIDHPLVGDDTGKDKVSPAQDPQSIAQSVVRQRDGPFDFLRAPVELKVISSPPDVTPPGAIDDLAVIGNQVGKNRIPVMFTVPGDDGDEDGNSYCPAPNGDCLRFLVKASKLPFTPEEFDELVPTPENGLVTDIKVGTARAGLTQAFSVGGISNPLAPATTYYIAVQASDDGRTSSAALATSTVPNYGPVSNVVSATTLTDDVSPGQPVLKVIETVKSNVVELSWDAPGDDGFEPGAPVAKYDLYVFKLRDWTESPLEDGEVPPTCDGKVPAATAGAFDYLPLPLVGANQLQTVHVKRLAPNTSYCFAVRGQDAFSVGPWSIVREARTLTEDKLKPGKPDPITAAVTGNTVTLSWPAVGDDGGATERFNDTPVCDYFYSLERALSDTDPTSIGQAKADNGAKRVTLLPQGIVAPGTTQTMTFHGLPYAPADQTTTWVFLVQAVDCADPANVGDLASRRFDIGPPPEGGAGDTEAPCAPHGPSGMAGPVKDGRATVELQWVAPGDDCDRGGPVASYKITLASGGEVPGVTYTPAIAAPGMLQRATVADLAPGTEYAFTITASDGTLTSDPATVAVRTLGTKPAEPVTVTDDDIARINADLQRTLKVERTGTVTRLGWTPPAATTVDRYLVWCLDPPKDGAAAGPIREVTEPHFEDQYRCDAGYVVTAVLDVDAGPDGSVATLDGLKNAEELRALAVKAPSTGSGLSTPILVAIIAGAALLLVGGVVLVMVLRRRGAPGQAMEGAPEAMPAEAPPAEAAAAEPAPAADGTAPDGGAHADGSQPPQ